MYFTYLQELSSAVTFCRKKILRKATDFTVRIIKGYGNGWLQKKVHVADLSGTGAASSKEGSSKYSYMKTLPGKREKEYCLYSKRTKHGKGRRRRYRTVYAKCNRGLH
jgi:hypothetical protein